MEPFLDAEMEAAVRKEIEEVFRERDKLSHELLAPVNAKLAPFDAKITELYAKIGVVYPRVTYESSEDG